MIRRRCIAVVFVTLVACRSAPSASTALGDSASVVALTACTANGATRNAVATLSIRVSPAPTARTSVKIEVEGETTKSITRDSTDQMHRFELNRGLYDVRISMPGFMTATARVTLPAGCAAELSATLRPRVQK